MLPSTSGKLTSHLVHIIINNVCHRRIRKFINCFDNSHFLNIYVVVGVDGFSYCLIKFSHNRQYEGTMLYTKKEN